MPITAEFRNLLPPPPLDEGTALPHPPTRKLAYLHGVNSILLQGTGGNPPPPPRQGSALAQPVFQKD